MWPPSETGRATTMLFLIYFTFLFTLANSSPIKNITRADPVYRLPQTIKPEHYDLVLTLPDDVFTTLTFTGELVLTIKPTVETSEIKIHANKLEFTEVITLTNEEGTAIDIEAGATDVVTDILTITTSSPLAAESTYKLQFKYSGLLRTEDMYGLYRSQYTENNVVKYLATTQFQTHYARRVFPCFDEPSFKATFSISINHPSFLTALGNTPLVDTSITPEGITTTFQPTPIMPTYLIAFIISEFTCDESTDTSIDVTHRICSREDTAPSRKLALDVGPKLLKALEDFTGVKYNSAGIGKIDQVAIPDFAAGAMENWGLATYRETALLWDEIESSNRYKQRVETVIAHELAHMWFGDLVTTHWWSDTFLNEGFATYFEFFSTAAVEQDWDLPKQFVIEELQGILQSDSLSTSQPLSLEVSSPNQISARFGSVSYSKGGSIFRMVEHFMGTEKFKEGLNKYLTTYALGNTQPNDLWDILQEFVTDLPGELKVIMENWVIKSGYPVLEVGINGNNITVSQKRFFTDGTTPDDADRWFVPISYTLSRDTIKFEDTSPKAWLLPNQGVSISDVWTEDQEWIILNNQQTGYYRISYSDVLLSGIITALNKVDFDGIEEINRAQLVDDFYNFVKAGLKTYSEFLNFIGFIEKDTSYFSWYPTITAFSNMILRTGNEGLSAQLSNHLSKLITELYNQVPFNTNNDDDQIYTHKKVLALNWGCRVGIEDCITNSLTAFANYKTTLEKPNKNLRSIVYCNGLRHSNNIAQDWAFLWDEYKKEELATEQVTILTALGCTKDVITLKNYLTMSITAGQDIRQQDALSVFSAVYSGNPEGVDTAAEFLYENHEAIATFYGAMNSKSSLMNGLVNRFTKQEQIDKLREFLDNPDVNDELKSAATVAHTNALANMEITKRLEDELTVFFESTSSSSTSTSSTSTSTSSSSTSTSSTSTSTSSTSTSTSSTSTSTTTEPTPTSTSSISTSTPTESTSTSTSDDSSSTTPTPIDENSSSSSINVDMITVSVILFSSFYAFAFNV